MSNVTGDNNRRTERFPSLLAEALDMPALSHSQQQQQQQHGDVSDYDYHNDGSHSHNHNHNHNHNDESNTEGENAMRPPPPLPPRSQSPNPPNGMERRMSSFDTPLIKNHHHVPPTTTTELPAAGFVLPPPNMPMLMPVPVHMHSNHSIHSMISTSSNSGGGSYSGSYIQEDNDTLPRHSDFTVPTSNFYQQHRSVHGNDGGAKVGGGIDGGSNSESGSNHASRMEPPLAIASEPPITTATGGRQQRSILGSNVAKKYHCTETNRRSYVRIPTAAPQNYGSTMAMDATRPPLGMVATTGDGNVNANVNAIAATTSSTTQRQQPADGGLSGHSTTTTTAIERSHHNRSSSRMTPKIIPANEYPDFDNYYDGIVPPEKPILTTGIGSGGYLPPERQRLLSSTGSDHRRHHHRHHHRHSENVHRGLHESVHAQSLLVGLAFMVIWLPNNAMAPNLTQIADFFGMNEAARDLYLGSYCALALGVFSLPLSGMIGFMADFYSRKHLFLACCVLGALTSAWSGWSPTYWNLFAARLCSGGCMSGSVPVAFSLLGDLFSKEERNAASSGLTSMMGLGIILGQIYAGEVGPSRSWQYPFYVSAVVQLIMAMMVAVWVEEPIRGGKEHALQGVFKSGNKYERRLTMKGFIDTMHKNASNWNLLWYGFLTSLPWGIVFVFLNDYLSQEQGFTVEQATFLVMLFGVGCAMGGITGGYLGQLFMKGNRSLLPLYMAASTFLGIFPFLLLLNSQFTDHNGFRSKFYCVIGGCIANLPSVNVRPCIINVNPPESRGAALTAANLFVALGRGIGPCCITLLGSVFAASRQTSFNITLSVFWTISAIQLLFLAKTLPNDQDRMEEELVRYAAAAQGDAGSSSTDVEGGGELFDKEHSFDDDDDDRKQQQQQQITMSPLKRQGQSESLIAVPPQTPDRRSSVRGGDDEDEDDDGLYDTIMTSPLAQYISIDGKSARQSLQFVKLGIQEFGDEINYRNAICRGCDEISPCSSSDELNRTDSHMSAGSVGGGSVGGSVGVGDSSLPGRNRAARRIDAEYEDEEEPISEAEIHRRRNIWMQQQQKQQQQQHSE